VRFPGGSDSHISRQSAHDGGKIGVQGKIADEDKNSVERALARLFDVTEKSGYLRNDLRKDILKAVSSPRNYFVQVQNEMEATVTAYKELEREGRENKEEIQRLQTAESNKTGQVATLLDQIRQENRGA